MYLGIYLCLRQLRRSVGMGQFGDRTRCIKTFALAALLLGLSAHSQAAFEPLPQVAPAPPDNPTTAAKVALGKQLIFDPRLSIDGNESCNSCHDVTGNGTDSRPESVGVEGQVGRRTDPTNKNADIQSTQYW